MVSRAWEASIFFLRRGGYSLLRLFCILDLRLLIF